MELVAAVGATEPAARGWQTVKTGRRTTGREAQQDRTSTVEYSTSTVNLTNSGQRMLFPRWLAQHEKGSE